jgi:hypothetical protein
MEYRGEELLEALRGFLRIPLSRDLIFLNHVFVTVR